VDTNLIELEQWTLKKDFEMGHNFTHKARLSCSGSEAVLQLKETLRVFAGEAPEAIDLKAYKNLGSFLDS